MKAHTIFTCIDCGNVVKLRGNQKVHHCGNQYTATERQHLVNYECLQRIGDAYRAYMHNAEHVRVSIDDYMIYREAIMRDYYSYLESFCTQ